MDETTTRPEIKLDPAVKTAWLDALRSGEYPQGKGLLRDNEGKFCCLGVLCEVAVEANVIPPAREDWESRGWKYAGNSMCAPPLAVRAWAHLADVEIFVGSLPRATTPIEALMQFNDKREWSFTKIADWIEANL